MKRNEKEEGVETKNYYQIYGGLIPIFRTDSTEKHLEHVLHVRARMYSYVWLGGKRNQHVETFKLNDDKMKILSQSLMKLLPKICCQGVFLAWNRIGTWKCISRWYSARSLLFYSFPFVLATFFSFFFFGEAAVYLIATKLLTYAIKCFVTCTRIDIKCWWWCCCWVGEIGYWLYF